MTDTMSIDDRFLASRQSVVDAAQKLAPERDLADPCVVMRYIGGALITMQMWTCFDTAMRRSEEGVWYPIDDGWRSANGRELLVRPDWNRKKCLAENPAPVDGAASQRDYL